MAVRSDSPAVKVARAHTHAWDQRDMEAARAALADGVHITVTTTMPGAPTVSTTTWSASSSSPTRAPPAV